MTQLLSHVRNAAVAVRDEAGACSGEELADRVLRLVAGLRRAGVTPGDRVVLVCGNRREFFEVTLASLYSGAVLVPVNTHLVRDELAYIVEDSGAAAMVVDGALRQVAAGDFDELGPAGATFYLEPSGGRRSYEALLAGESADDAGPELQGSWMFYTSGTTGRPKGVRPLAGSTSAVPFASTALGFCDSFGMPRDGVTLLCGPAYHGAQLAFSLWPLLAGSTVRMTGKFSALRTLEIMRDEGVTNVHLVPTQFVRMLKLDPETREVLTPRDLVVAFHGAAPCGVEVKRQMIEWWGPRIVEYYGATEAGLFAVATSQDWLERPGTVGRSIGNFEVFAVDDEGVRLGVGEVGALYIRTRDGADFEYHNDEAKTSAAHLEPGVFSVGDVGYVDEDGYVFLADRKIDMIISGGVNIYPAEIEGVLQVHPAVADAAVIGVPNEEFGEEVKAIVQLRDGVAATDELPDELRTWCRERLASFKVPRSVDFVDTVPRSAAGKLEKRGLRERYWADAGRAI